MIYTAILFIACAISISIATSTGVEALRRSREATTKSERLLYYTVAITAVLTETFVVVSFWISILGRYNNV